MSTRPGSCIAALFAGFLAVSIAAAAPGASSARPTLATVAEAIGPEGARRAIASLSARADGDGPRGPFTSEIVSLAASDVAFRLRRGGSATELLLLDGAPYSRESAAAPFAPGDAALAGFIRGHELHRILLDLDRRFSAAARPVAAGCLALVDEAKLDATLCPAAGTGLPGTLERALPAESGGGTIRLEFDDWREVLGVRLPFAAAFVRAGERHTYRYTEVLPFRLAPGAPLPAEPGARFARLADMAGLAAEHHRVMEAHRRSDVGMLLGAGNGTSTISGRGRLSEVPRDELAARLGPYLASTRFSRYEDVVAPVVALSADGTLGWLACQIEAEGMQATGEPPKEEAIAFGFSWVELYARAGDRWRSLGNASSEKP